MPDIVQFGAIMTDQGCVAISNAYLTGRMVPPTYFAVGDGGGVAYTPASSQTSLRGEVWRGKVSFIEQDKDRPQKVRVFSAIPAVAGPFIIREMAIFDDNGLMIAVCNTPTLEKPIIESGAVLDMSVGMAIVVDHPEVVSKLIVDPKVILLSRTDLNRHDADDGAHEVRFGLLEASEELIQIDHGMGGYPLVLVGRLQHALGVGGLGDGPCGGTITEQCAARACYLDSNRISVLVSKKIVALGTEPELHQIGDQEYAVIWSNNQVDSLFIRLI